MKSKKKSVIQKKQKKLIQKDEINSLKKSKKIKKESKKKLSRQSTQFTSNNQSQQNSIQNNKQKNQHFGFIEQDVIQAHTNKSNYSNIIELSKKNLLQDDQITSSQSISQEQKNQKFHIQLAKVYSEIDKYSDLQWAAKDQYELVNNSGKRCLRKDVNNKQKEESADWQKNFHGSIGYGEITRGALTNFITVCQNIEHYIKKACAEDNINIKKLPFQPQECNLVTQKSTFLDIGSGFGKPNFHVALQVFPKLSLGIEVVPARVIYCMDQLYNFQEKFQLRKELNLQNSQEQTSCSNQINESQNNKLTKIGHKEKVAQIKSLETQIAELQQNLKNANLLKGHSQNLQKLQKDINQQLLNLKQRNEKSEAPSVKQENSIFKKSEEAFELKSHYDENWYQCVDFEIKNAAVSNKKEQVEPYKDRDGNHFTHIYSYNKVMTISDRRSIAQILNKTNFRILAWYFNPKESAICGLKKVKLCHKMPMQSTGKEKFTVYIYFKTQKYDEKKPWSDSESEVESDEQETIQNSKRF